MTATTSQFVIVVEGDPKKREEFSEAFKKHSDIAVFIEESIFDACCKWLLLYEKGLSPRAVITNWNVHEADACTVDERDKLFKSGAHFLLMQCAKLTDEGLLVVYTSDPQAACEGIAGSIEEDRTVILSKKQISVAGLILWLEHQHAFTQ